MSHGVDASKGENLSALGVPCFEIVLTPDKYESWTWDNLRQEVLECAENRHWIFNPDFVDLSEQARCEAIAKASAKPIKTASTPEIIRLRLFGVPVHLRIQVWGVCLWWPYFWRPYNERVNDMLKAIAKSFGGRYNGDYRNWVIPVGAKTAVLEQLNGIGAIRDK